MDIPKLMTDFAGEELSSVVNTLVKNVSFKGTEEKKEKLNVLMDLNLDEGWIEFGVEEFKEKDPRLLNYFGNNPAAAKQVYVVRDVKSMSNFWLGRMKGILMNLLEFLEEGELKELMKACQEQGLFDDRGINLKKLSEKYDGKGAFHFDREAKSIVMIKDQKTEKISFDKFFSVLLEASSNSKFVLVNPRIKKDGKIISISKHEDYISGISKMMEGSSSREEGVCHICGKKSSDINTKEYSSKFDKSGLGKVFVTTTVNYAPSFKKDLHQNNFAVCKGCYEKFLHGEKEVMKKFRIKVAKEDCILLFEGIDRKIDTEYMEGLTKDIDVVFNPAKVKDWDDKFIREVEKKQKLKLYQFNMVFYKTDGKATSIKKTIENISSIRFATVLSAMEEGRLFVNDYVRSFTLGHVYGLYPINTNKKGEQINIKGLLNLYSDIIKGDMISRKYLFEIIAEGFSRMMNELRSSEIRNYKNIISRRPLSGKATAMDMDINIERLAMKYIAFIHSLEKLKIIEEEVFDVSEKEIRDQLEEPKEYVRVREEFLDKNGFKPWGRGLFYLGGLMYEIGHAQYKQGHKHKPILDKLEYKGMSKADILEFYNDLLEKLRQYRRVIYREKGPAQKCESFMKQIAYYIGSPDSLNDLDERQAVFYIMSGYGFSVSNRKYTGAPEDKANSESDMEEGLTEGESSEG